MRPVATILLSVPTESALAAVAYTSSARGLPSDAALEALLVRCRQVNAEQAVTGALLYHDGNFFQYFEGPPAGVAAVYARVLRAPLHHGVIELARGPIAARAFDGWQMGFCRAPASLVLKLSQAAWTLQAEQLLEDRAASDGLALLLHFWQTRGRHLLAA